MFKNERNAKIKILKYLISVKKVLSNFFSASFLKIGLCLPRNIKLTVQFGCIELLVPSHSVFKKSVATFTQIQNWCDSGSKY